MEQRHRKVIRQNLTALIARTTRLRTVLTLLFEKNVFSEEMIGDYNHARDKDELCERFYKDIQRRGPEAFDKLVEAMCETGQWDVVRILAPDHPLNPKPEFISLKNVPKKNPHAPAYPAGSTPNSGLTNAKSPIPGNSPSNVPKSIKVIMATAFAKSTHPDIPCYSMKSRRRGILYIINNIEFDNNIEEIREGASVDQRNLEQLFKQIGFHLVKTYNNLTKDEMENCLQNLSISDELNQTDCIFFVFASHGRFQSGVTSILCKDGKTVDCHVILEMFNNKHCPRLHNIPKIFVFQLCRGDNYDYGYKAESNDLDLNRTKTDGRSDQYQMRTFSDMLIVHSTLPGFTSHRDTNEGSWYIQSLCEIFTTHCHNTHVEDLFKLVDQNLQKVNSRQKTMQTSSVEKWGFNKHCYLNPGLYEN